jgi:reductive dehalogenase
MMKTTFSMPLFLGPHAIADPKDRPFHDLSPENMTRLVKNYALHLGADLVGICRVNPLWAYSHRGEIHYGNWEDWGQEITDIPTYAVVFCTEMDKDHVDTAPHTASLAESGANYAKGAYISTLLAHWFAHMGYRGVAEHNRHYTLILPPLAVDAGLGEIGRMGYLIAPIFGPRVRIFATLTDMPLIPDHPISLGVDTFCTHCKKCSHACPSKSIPSEGKTVHNGIEKWKINEDTCFEYWSKVGTDCCVCMAICPFSRPNTLIHRAVRWCLIHSRLAQLTFPYVDRFLYGNKWRSKASPSWIPFSKP